MSKPKVKVKTKGGGQQPKTENKVYKSKVKLIASIHKERQ